MTAAAASARPNPAPLPGSYPIKTLVYGVTGTWKSTFALTFPKPILYHCFDPWGKEGPARRLGDASPLKQTAEGVPFFEVTRDGALLVRVEHFIDQNPERPAAMALFRKRYAEVFDSGEIRQYATYVLDSVTFLDQLAVHESTYAINRGVKDDRLHARYSAFELRKILQGRIAGYPPLINIVVIAHVANKYVPDEKGGGSHLPTTMPETAWKYEPAAPGSLKDRLPPGFSELYRAYHTSDGKPGGMKVLLQTRPNFEYNANTQIMPPNPCEPRYECLWVKS